MRYDGHTYVANSVEVAPPEGESLGGGTFPPCNDTDDADAAQAAEQAQVAELEGVDPFVAIVLAGRDDVVFIREDVDSEALPPELTRLFRAAECDPRDEPIELTGPWLGIIGAEAETEDPMPPYALEIFVEESSPPRYGRAYLTVRVPAELGRPLTREDVRSSLWEGGRLSLTVTCRDGDYVAQQVEAYPPA